MRTSKSVKIAPLSDVHAAKNRITDSIIRTPLVRLNVDYAPANIYLKLENPQPMRSLKIRGAMNAMRIADKEELGRGV